MKKILSLVLFITLVATACGKNTEVLCKSDATNNGMTIKQEYRIRYLKDKVTSVVVTKSYSFEEAERFNNFETVINHTISNMNELTNDHIGFSSEKSENKYTTQLNVEMEKTTDEELEKLGLYKDLKEFKTTLEEQGLTCK